MKDNHSYQIRVKWLSCLFVLLLSSLHSIAQSDGSKPVKYVYDENGRLHAIIIPTGEAVVYNYDPVGNLLSVARLDASSLSILAISPGTGPAGTKITITGTGFSPIADLNAVAFNGVTAPVLSSTRVEIVAEVPASASTGLITVKTPNGTARSQAPFTVGEMGSANEALGRSRSKASFNPPGWILGEWATLAESNLNDLEKFVFASNEIKLTEGFGEENKVVEFSREFKNAQIKETIEPNLYRFEINTGENEYVYEFKLCPGDICNSTRKEALTYSLIKNRKIVRDHSTSINLVLLRPMRVK